MRRNGASLGRTAVSALLVEGLIRFTPLPRTCRLLGVRLGPTADDAVTRTNPGLDARVSSIATEVARVYTSLPLPDTCLRRALTAGFRLRHLQPRLVLGVRKGAAFRAHAWLEVGGQVLDWGNTHREYVRIPF
jgi:Transglutaminase-like superfamily